MSAAFTARRRAALPPPHKPASFTSSLIGSAMVVVIVEGEIDACNARDLAQYTEDVLHAKRRLIVDRLGECRSAAQHDNREKCCRTGKRGHQIDSLKRRAEAKRGP